LLGFQNQAAIIPRFTGCFNRAELYGYSPKPDFDFYTQFEDAVA